MKLACSLLAASGFILVCDNRSAVEQQGFVYLYTFDVDGQKSKDIEEGSEYEFECAHGGQKHSLKFVRSGWAVYRREGLEFKFNSHWSAWTEKKEDEVVVNLDDPATAFKPDLEVHIYEGAASKHEVKKYFKEFSDTMKKEFGQVEEDDCEEEFGGAKHRGRSFVYQLKGIKFETDLFVFKSESKTYAAVFSTTEKDADKIQESFKTVLKSWTIK
jgi:hypothetical protein